MYHRVGQGSKAKGKRGEMHKEMKECRSLIKARRSGQSLKDLLGIRRVDRVANAQIKYV